MKRPAFVTGELETRAGAVPRIGSTLTRRDHMGSAAVRLGINRGGYIVEPGLYALGSPAPSSPVLVSANYKLSFDKLRASMAGRDAWILVLDTRGINVWCAAGKGTFGTAELINRIVATNLDKVVEHRRLIVPQLGAPGVAGHEVVKFTGFAVRYGPVRCEDLPAYIDAGMKATEPMRRKLFPIAERCVLVPVELLPALKKLALLAPLVFFLAGVGGPGSYWQNVSNAGVLAAVALLGAVIAGAAMTPVLLPWLPGRAFSLKGVWPGLLTGLGVVWLLGPELSSWSGWLESSAWILICTALSAFLAMNFTGASTYTSISGVRKEMAVALPLQVVVGGIGVALWIGARVTGWISV